MFGGPTIAHALIEHDLIDEYRLFVHPVTLGAGAPLFPSDANRRRLEFVDTQAFDGGAIYVHWART